MPKIDGREYKVLSASWEETQLMHTIQRNKEMIKELYETNEKLMKTLESSHCKSYVNSEGTRMTYLIGQPKGKFVQFPELDFVHHAKTTKKDLESLPV